VEEGEDVMLPGLGRARPVPLDPIHVLDMLVEFSNWLEHVGVVLLSLGVLLEDFAVVVGGARRGRRWRPA
jgi:hypothetical protein